MNGRIKRNGQIIAGQEKEEAGARAREHNGEG